MTSYRYSGLGKKLLRTKECELSLSFDHIERLNNWPLPPSAKIHLPWWGNDERHVQARYGWLAVGWRVKSVNLQDEVVHFKKVEERQVQPPPNKLVNQSHDNLELIARKCLFKIFNVPLWPRKDDSINVFFDLSSEDGSIVGEVKYLSRTKSGYIPTTALDSITSSVWLIEKAKAPKKFMVFGGDREIPEKWLARYGRYTNVLFYFINNNNEVERLI